MAKLLGEIERRRPGLVAQLRAGSRPALPDIRHVDVTLDGSNRGAGVMTARTDGSRFIEGRPDLVMLGDRGTIEGLRFALAERAAAHGDQAGLRRLLPLTLPGAAVDLPARNAFARRLEKMAQLAGRPVVAESERAELVSRIARWRLAFTVSNAVRPAMQLICLSGLICALMGWRLRRRLQRMEQAHAVLEEPRQNRHP